MSELLSLEIPDDLAKQARALAAATNRRFEDAIVEWIEKAVAEPSVETLPNEQLLALCDAALDARAQEELSDLLERQKEGALVDAQRQRLGQLLAMYRRGLVMKARAIKEAAARGLKAGLADDAA